MKLFLSALLSACFALPSPLSAKPKEPADKEPSKLEEVLKGLEEFDKNLTGFGCAFKQTNRLKPSRVEASVEGVLTFKKPDLLYLEHQKPKKQITVSDGKTIQIYKPEDNTLIQESWAKWKQSDLAAGSLLNLGSYSTLRSSFTLSLSTSPAEPLKKSGETVTLKFVPISSSISFELEVTLDSKTFMPLQSVLILDNMDVISSFKKIELNPEIPDSKFNFEAPEGAFRINLSDIMGVEP